MSFVITIVIRLYPWSCSKKTVAMGSATYAIKQMHNERTHILEMTFMQTLPVLEESQ